MSQNVDLVIRTKDQSSGPINEIRRTLSGLESDAKGVASRGLGGLEKLLGVGIKAAVATGTAALAGLGAAIVKSTDAAADMEQSLANIKANMGLTADEAKRVGDLITDLGLDPNLQVTATEAAQAIDMLGKNGLQLTDIMGGAARSTVLLANSTGADFAQAADIATDVMAQFNIGAEDMALAVNGITGVTQNSKFDINDYALAIAQAGGVAGSVGVDFDDFNAVIAAISPNFASGSDAGTSFKTFLQRLEPDTDKAKEAMAALGLYTEETGSAFFDAQGQMRPMNEIAGLLQGAFGGLSEQQKINAATTIFGTDAMRAAFGLAEAGAPVIDMLKASIGNVDAEEAATTRMDTFRGVLEVASGIVETLTIQIGQKFLPVLRPLVERFIELGPMYGEQLVAWFGRVADAINVLITQVGSMALIFEDGSGILANFLTALGMNEEKAQTLGQQIWTLKETIKGFALVIWDAIEPVVAAITQFVSWHDVLLGLGTLIGIIAVQALGGLVAAMAPVLAVVAAAIGVVALMRNAWESNWFGIRDHVAEIVPKVQEIITLGIDLIQQLWGEGSGQLETVTQRIWDAIGVIVDLAMGAIKTTLDVAIDLLQGDWQGAWDTIEGALTTAWGNMKEAVSTALEAIKGFFDTGPGAKVLDWLQETFPQATAAMQEAWGQAVDAVKGILDALGIKFDGTGAGIKTVLENIGSWWRQHGDAVRNIVDTVISLALGTMGDMFEAAANIVRAILLALQGDWSGAWEAMREAGNIIWGRISENVSAVLGAMRKVYDLWIVQYVEAALGKWAELRDGITERITTVKDNLKERWDWIKETTIGTWRDMVENVTTRVQSWVDWLKGKFELIKGFVTTYLNPLEWAKAGWNWIQGLWDGVQQRWDAFKSWLSSKWDGMVQGFKDFFGIRSPSELMRSLGQYLPMGLGLGIEDKAQAAYDALAGVGTSLAGQASSIVSGITSSLSNITVPTIGSATGGGSTTPTTGLVGGINLADPVAQKEAQDTAKASLGDFLAGLGDFLVQTVKGFDPALYNAASLTGPDTKKAILQGNANTDLTIALRNAYSSLLGQIESVLGIDQSELKDFGANVLADAAQQLGANTSSDSIQALLQAAVNLRGEAINAGVDGYYGGAATPTDGRLTGNTYNVDINLTSNGDTASDLQTAVDITNLLFA